VKYRNVHTGPGLTSAATRAAHPGNRPTAIAAGPGHHRRAFALVWAAMRRDVAEIAVAGVVGSIGYDATAWLEAAALTCTGSLSGETGAAPSLPGLTGCPGRQADAGIAGDIGADCRP
jgi:hypothetical protein